MPSFAGGFHTVAYDGHNSAAALFEGGAKVQLCDHILQVGYVLLHERLVQPYLASSAACAAGETAFSLMKGPPGTARMTKKVTVMTTHTVKIASPIRFGYTQGFELIFSTALCLFDYSFQKPVTFFGKKGGPKGMPLPAFVFIFRFYALTLCYMN